MDTPNPTPDYMRQIDLTATCSACGSEYVWGVPYALAYIGRRKLREIVADCTATDRRYPIALRTHYPNPIRVHG